MSINITIHHSVADYEIIEAIRFGSDASTEFSEWLGCFLNNVTHMHDDEDLRHLAYLTVCEILDEEVETTTRFVRELLAALDGRS